MDEEVEDEEEDKGLIFDDDDWVLLDAGFEEADFEINSDLRVGCLLKLGFEGIVFEVGSKDFLIRIIGSRWNIANVGEIFQNGSVLGGPRALF